VTNGAPPPPPPRRHAGGGERSIDDQAGKPARIQQHIGRQLIAAFSFEKQALDRSSVVALTGALSAR
jgi:hypothetical protein